MGVNSPASILYDQNGNPVAITLDGSTYRLETTGKLQNTSGTVIDPATETTLAALKTNFDAEDFASETTLDAVRDNIGEAVGSPAVNTLMARLQTVVDRLTSIKDTDGVQIIDDIVRIGDTARNGINSILNNAIRRLEARSSITSPDGSADVNVSSNRLAVESVQAAGTNHKVRIQDGGGSSREAYVDSANRLLVTANATVVPPASVAVNVEAISSLTGTADTAYLIPSGKQLTITRFAAGVEANSGRVTKVSLFYDPAGTGTGMTLLQTMYLGSGDRNYEFGLDFKETGDGTALIRLRRERLDGGADEVAAFWSGFRDV